MIFVGGSLKIFFSHATRAFDLPFPDPGIASTRTRHPCVVGQTASMNCVLYTQYIYETPETGYDATTHAPERSSGHLSVPRAFHFFLRPTPIPFALVYVQ